MTRENFSRWTCNSCGDRVETATNAQPKGWVGYGFTEPDVPAGEPSVLGHLCQACALQINNAL